MAYRPLADEIRPSSLDDVVGQGHILGKDGLLRRIIEGGDVPNLIFYGPSGTGKTTVANIIAQRTRRPLHRLNATTAAISDIKEIMGQVGTLPMSAVAIINQLLFVFNLCIWGALAGAGIFGAQYYGQGNMEGVRQTLRMKLLIAVGLLVIAFGVLLGAGRPLIELYISADTTAADATATMEYALGYLRVMLAGLIPFALTQAYASTLRESGQTTLPMRARLTADPNRLLALPYRLGVFLHSAWLLAAYTQLKNRFL